MKPRVGLIGLGLMGAPMGANLLKAGFPLTVWNRTAEKAQKLAAQGASVAKSPQDAASQADVLFTIVSDPPALEEVLWGNQGAFAGLKKGSVLIDSSTVSPALARRISKACSDQSVDFLDAPVTGGTWGAEKGELIFMIGGKKEVLDRVEPVLQAVGKRFFLLGPNGSGQTVKLAMNLILALEVEALAEGLELVTSSGVEPTKLIEVLQS
ncbi:MAG: NAD(P)-dependent oxidoreductase, partial [Candidatus Acidiferrales bacterium]